MLHTGVACWAISTVQRTASTTLTNSAGFPSPIVLTTGLYVRKFLGGSKPCIALIALGEEPFRAYTIHHARSLVRHCLSVHSRRLRKERGRISRTAWPSWASRPCRPPRWDGHSFRRWRMSPDLHGCVRG